MNDSLNNINKLIVNNKVLANLDAIPEYMNMDLFMAFLNREVFPVEDISFDDINLWFIYQGDTATYIHETYEIEPLTFEKFLKILINDAKSRPVNLRAAMYIGSDTSINGISPPVETVSNTNVEYYLRKVNGGYGSHYELFMTTKLPAYINAIEYKLIIAFEYNAINNTFENLKILSATSREETNGAAAHILMIPETSWVANTMSTTLTGLDFVTLSSIILVTPEPPSADKYANSGIMCTAQGNGTLTFTCNVLPTEPIIVNCVVF